MSAILIDISGGSQAVLLILTMIVSLILGMGVPTTAAYLMLALLVVPTLKDMNVPAMAAHLFIFYFGIISNVTPPVALAAYAAAGVARCNPTKTGFFAFKLSLSGFILPFMFVYNPVLLMQGEPMEIIQAVITALLGIYSLSCALEKFAFAWNINRIEQAILFVSALLLIVPGTVTDLVGLAVLVAIFALKYMSNRNKETMQNA